MQVNNALITGGAGFIGSHLTRALLAQNREVTILDNLSTGKLENVPQAADFREGDIQDRDLVSRIIKERKIDVVFHEAARVSIRDSIAQFQEDARTNITGTLSVLSACRDTDVKKIVYASSMAVYSDSPTPEPIAEIYETNPISGYGISKLTSEKYCLLLAKEMGISATALRYFNTFGVGQAYTPYVGVITIFINRLLKGEPLLIFGAGEQRRDYTHVSDIVQGNLLALSDAADGEIFNIGAGKATSVNDLAHILARKMNPGAEIQHLDAQPGELQNAVADITKARQRLGYAPQTNLDTSLDELVSSHKNQN